MRKNPNFDNLSFQVGDATDLQFEDNYFDSVTISFGIRNIPDLVGSINEMTRVIKPNGIFAIMEFGTPAPPFNWLYKIYSKYIIPNIGKLMSGNDSAYNYLPETIKKFPYGDTFKQILLDTGLYSKVEFNKFEFGTVYAYYCTKK
jgi:demethylmenaquinone methyltransferase / 2-methoxy-6-polyprenyl-1,4-benzoquinol methylase